MNVHRLISVLLVMTAACCFAGCDSSSAESTNSQKPTIHLTNVSYDPTRELYADFNQEFAKHWRGETGRSSKSPRRTPARARKPER